RHRPWPLRPVHAGDHGVGPAPGVARSRPPHRLRRRPCHDRAGDRARARRRDGTVQGPMIVYKITAAAPWREAEAAGSFAGAPIDVRDGYIHLSTAAQVRETARLHFAGMDDLLLVAVDAEALG